MAARKHPLPTSEEFHALLDGTLDGDDLARVEKALETDPKACEELDRLVDLKGFRGSYVPQKLATAERPEEFLESIITRLKAGDVSPGEQPVAMDFLDRKVGGQGEPGLLGDYEIHELIARGGMGLVFKGHDPQLQRDVAIKVLSPSLAESPAACEQFLEEARSAAALDHPNVMPIFAVHPGHSVPYFVMPLIDGPTLAAVIADDGPLSVRKAAEINGKVARALVAAHEKGLVHRDIKPANILVKDGSGRVLVADFGIAVAAGQQQRVISGTPDFMAPEQAAGEAATPAADVFALGKVLADCTEARPSWMKRLLSAMTAEDPEQRPTASGVESILRRHSRRSVLPHLAVAAVVVLLGAVLVASSSERGFLGTVNQSLGGSAKPFWITGRLGSYPTLAAAVKQAGEGDWVVIDTDARLPIVELDITRAVTLAAGPGRDPVLVQEDQAVGMFRVRAPLSLVGLTFHRDVAGPMPLPMLAVEGSSISMQSCGIYSSQGQTSFYSRACAVELKGDANLEARDCVFATNNSNAVNLGSRSATGERGEIRARMENCFLAGGMNFSSSGGIDHLTLDLENVSCGGVALWVADPGYELPKTELRVKRSVVLMSRTLVWLPQMEDQWQQQRVSWAGEENIYADQSGFLGVTLSKKSGKEPGMPVAIAQWAEMENVEEAGSQVVEFAPRRVDPGDLAVMKALCRDLIVVEVGPRLSAWPERGVDINRLPL